ncbi:hypothetical protein GIB67_040426 [Kingdonia uniflora]|uniref:Uncharacterized protein n=1 Tax=Kingdonia uniflora TaxID=39325 RepID=A0A7J7KXK2_9MAGN|nr:hypothetical protein GIB67_040426 [Kingdonia uniflora]
MRVFANTIVESSEVTFGITRIGEYELHYLILIELIVWPQDLYPLKLHIIFLSPMEDHQGRTSFELFETSFSCGLGTTGGRHRGGRGQDSLIVNRDLVSDDAAIPALSRETPRYGSGSETPMYPSRTPLYNFMTPMRDPGATPIHDGMRTPMRDQVWNPYTPMSPASSMNDHKTIIGIIGKRETQPHGELQPHRIRYLILLALLLASSHFISCWEKNLLHLGTPLRPYETPTPSSDWSKTHVSNYGEPRIPQLSSPAYANAPSPYASSTPGIQPTTPGSACYLPGTPSVQPITPGGVMSPVIVNRDLVSDDDALSASIRETLPLAMVNEVRYQCIHHPSKTPLHNFMTPMRDPGGTRVVVAYQSKVSPLSGFTTKCSFWTGSCCIIELVENFPLRSPFVVAYFTNYGS